jgi:hypothetical protein
MYNWYHTVRVHAQVHRTSLYHTSNMLWIKGPQTASPWVMRRVRSFFPVDT